MYKRKVVYGNLLGLTANPVRVTGDNITSEGFLSPSLIMRGVEKALTEYEGIIDAEFKDEGRNLGIDVRKAGDARASAHGSAYFYFNSRIGINDDKQWVGERQIYLLALHEMGHILGLGHDSDIGSIMHPMAPGKGVLTEKNKNQLIKKWGKPGASLMKEDLKNAKKGRTSLKNAIKDYDKFVKYIDFTEFEFEVHQTQEVLGGLLEELENFIDTRTDS